MKIECDTLEEFLNVVDGLVKRGLMFDSDAHNLTITLTGGY